MLFPYQYVPHSLELIQDYIDYIFLEVWCKADSKKKYSLDLFDGFKDWYNQKTKNPEQSYKHNFDDEKISLKDTVGGFKENGNKDYKNFGEGIENIYAIFQNLSSEKIDKLRKYYQDSQKIEELCQNNESVLLISKKDLEKVLDKPSFKKFSSFFEGLYKILSRGNTEGNASDDQKRLLYEKTGFLIEHYQNFIKINNEGICHYCGIVSFEGEFTNQREAYDHYLPKATYIFSVVNLKNLSHSLQSPAEQPPSLPLKKEAEVEGNSNTLYYEKILTNFIIEIRNQNQQRFEAVSKVSYVTDGEKFQPPISIFPWKDLEELKIAKSSLEIPSEVIEIEDINSAESKSFKEKIQAYHNLGIQAVWIVNLSDCIVEIYSLNESQKTYQKQDTIEWNNIVVNLKNVFE